MFNRLKFMFLRKKKQVSENQKSENQKIVIGGDKSVSHTRTSEVSNHNSGFFGDSTLYGSGLGNSYYGSSSSCDSSSDSGSSSSCDSAGSCCD